MKNTGSFIQNKGNTNTYSGRTVVKYFQSSHSEGTRNVEQVTLRKQLLHICYGRYVFLVYLYTNQFVYIQCVSARYIYNLTCLHREYVCRVNNEAYINEQPGL